MLFSVGGPNDEGGTRAGGNGGPVVNVGDLDVLPVLLLLGRFPPLSPPTTVDPEVPETLSLSSDCRWGTGCDLRL